MEFSDKTKLGYTINFLILGFILSICMHVVHSNCRHGKSVYKTIEITAHLIILSLAFVIVCIFLLRIKLLIEELLMRKEYTGVISILKSLNFNTLSWAVIAITFISLLIIVNNLKYDSKVVHFHPSEIVLALVFSLFLLYTIKINECRVTLVETIFNSRGLDPGSAMAGSYFYGYLKIMLPSSGGIERAGMLSAIEQFEANKKVEIPVKKLFILIPSSSYISPDLREMTENRLEHIGKLDTIVLNRAGVINRTYHNSVYKIHQREPNGYPKKSIYAVVEGATPLKTYLETRTKSNLYGPMYKEFNHEIVENFYSTLKNLLNDNPDCRDYCELIYYDDESSTRVNAADVITARIKSLINYN